MNLAIHTVSGMDDPFLPGVLDIFQESFPLREQMRFSWWIETLRGMVGGPDRNRVAVR